VASTNSTISVQDGVDNGILQLRGSTRTSSPGSYIQLYGPNGSFGKAVFNYGYHPSSELSFHVNNSEKIRFGGSGEIEAKSLTTTENISGSATSTGSMGSLKIDGASVDFTGLPTSDPSIAGRLYNDSGVLKISAG